MNQKIKECKRKNSAAAKLQYAAEISFIIGIVFAVFYGILGFVMGGEGISFFATILRAGMIFFVFWLIRSCLEGFAHLVQTSAETSNFLELQIAMQYGEPATSKEAGYIPPLSQWECAACGVKNPSSVASCQSCGKGR